MEFRHGRGDNDGAKRGLMDIEHASRRTLEEMRALIGVLRGSAPDAPTASAPTITRTAETPHEHTEKAESGGRAPSAFSRASWRFSATLRRGRRP